MWSMPPVRGAQLKIDSIRHAPGVLPCFSLERAAQLLVVPTACLSIQLRRVAVRRAACVRACCPVCRRACRPRVGVPPLRVCNPSSFRQEKNLCVQICCFPRACGPALLDVLSHGVPPLVHPPPPTTACRGLGVPPSTGRAACLFNPVAQWIRHRPVGKQRVRVHPWSCRPVFKRNLLWIPTRKYRCQFHKCSLFPSQGVVARCYTYEV
eukprot:6468387-Amphidinium_carterae.1